jgi:RHS repeat-associated protein
VRNEALGGGVWTRRAPRANCETDNVPASRNVKRFDYANAWVRFGQSAAPEGASTYDVRAFDAAGDGKAIETTAINKASSPVSPLIPVSVLSFDGSGLPSPWGGNGNSSGTVSTSYDAQNTIVTDQAQHTRRNTTDALGRLVQVVEDPGGHNYGTSYSYDVLDDLIGVTQGSQGRTFQYESLKRLTQAVNPETGAIGYSYDGNGNLLTKSDARGITTTYTYDALNRMVAKQYSDSTPMVGYFYDQGGQYSIGHLTGVVNANAATNYTGFDPLGRVVASQQVTAGQTYSFSYTYNLAGSLTGETYPSGRGVTTNYDGANRASAVSGSFNGQQTPYVSGETYAPHGAPSFFWYGNQLARTLAYNSRLQLSSSQDAVQNSPTSILFSVSPGWGGASNNGNLRGETIYEGGPGQLSTLTPFNRSYTYDAVNRLASASDTGGWSRSFGYDAFGKMWVSGYSGIPRAGNTPGAPTAFNANNQITTGGASFDDAGNQIFVNGNTAAYDAENRQISVTDGVTQSVESYVYDGEGKRVEKIGPSGTTVFVYDAFGELAAEYSTASNTSPCATCYFSTDHLNSTRLVTNQNGTVVARHDYLPFGEEVSSNSSDNINQKFTGKERDQETGLDYFGARYYGSALGRFTSPDSAYGYDAPRNKSATLEHVCIRYEQSVIVRGSRWARCHCCWLQNVGSGRGPRSIDFGSPRRFSNIWQLRTEGRWEASLAWPVRNTASEDPSQIRQRWCAACGLSGGSRWGGRGS